MPWIIQTQEESAGKGEKREVQVKEIKFFPVEGRGGVIEGFKALGFLLLQIIIKHEKAGILKLKLNGSQGIHTPTFVVQHEDREDYPLVWYGAGKRRVQVYDRLAPKQKIPGEKEKYETLAAFEKRVKQLGGDSLVTEVVSLFAAKMGEVVQRRETRAKQEA
jgi:hypothetical protein